MKKSTVLFALVAAGMATSALAAEPTPFNVQQLVNLNKLHSAAVSNDGKSLVYGVKVVDDQGEASSDLYLLDLTNKNAQPKQITAAAGTEHDVSFSADNKSIYFLASRSGSSQLYQLALNGGEAMAVTDLPLDINGYKLSQDGKQVVLTMRVFPECKDLACSKDKFTAIDESKTSGREYKQLMVRHWDTWEDHARNHLFVGQLNGKKITEPTNVTANRDTETPPKPFSGMEEVTFTPDGKHVVYSAKAPSLDQAWTTNYDLWQVPVTGGETVNLTEANTAWDSQPTFSADGRYLAYLAMTKPGYEADRYRIMLRDNVTGQEKEVAPLWDRSPSSLTFSADGRTLYVTAQDVGQVSIFEVNTQFGDVRPIYNQGSNSLIAVTNNQLIFKKSSLVEPGDLFSVTSEGEQLTQLTDVNKDKLANIKFGEYEQFNFKGWNDETVHGYWIKPANYEEGKQYPIAYLVHGGPQGSFGNSFSGRWNAQLWAGAGYGVVMVDFHGSTGYGQAFTDSIGKDWGGKPLEDLKKGMASVTAQQPWLDANNACALGGSYGGYMMNWFQGNWNDGFQCLVNHAGLFDMRSMYYVTEELWFPEYEFGGSYDKNKELFEKFNPVNYVENWKTPMLVIHGEKDYRVPYGQGLAAYTYMQRNGIPSELLVFPDENHWILNQDNLQQWYKNVLGWMDRWTAK
ncbi:alpha/beta hydrolase family protein [Shewanella saliphila]|uniref:Peptidase S9 n=1 Tax=Shewanella saliphila TaxID=2282698 RepID=A0ABQ2Q282_9GAMM|nr:S9 family peptidase [Shewanella saliphila]MCL1100313.1 S9 family peptidase [Shewanella saliphila]GGP37930.1 peptidase S9 [Shewanella saliphila]